MTTEELLTLPDDGIERWLVKGQVRTRQTEEQPEKKATRLRIVSRFMEAIPPVADPYRNVLVESPADNTTALNVDFVLGTPECVLRTGTGRLVFRGVPVLAGYVLRGPDTYGQIWEREDELLAMSVPLVWVVNTYARTIMILRPDQRLCAVNEVQELDGGPELPGFRVPVARLLGE